MTEINMDSIMKKVGEKAVNSSFLAAKLTGRQYEITCHSCHQTVKVVITEKLTGVCPLCGHENELTFSIA